VRWLVAGLAFMGVSATLLTCSSTSPECRSARHLRHRRGLHLLRFAVNHHWVFSARNPIWRQCVQYHVANAGAFSVWWIAANVLALLGVHYLIAGILAVGVSTFFSLFANLLGLA
jgi:hypothetical protein